MFITYFIQPWKYYNIGRRCCQEVNRILVTDCYFLGIGKKMLIFLAFWDGLFELWINYEFFVNFFEKRIAFVPTSPYLKGYQNRKMGKIGLRDVRIDSKMISKWYYLCFFYLKSQLNDNHTYNFLVIHSNCHKNLVIYIYLYRLPI